MDILHDRPAAGQQERDRYELARELAAATPRTVPLHVIGHWLAMIRRHGRQVALGLLDGLRDRDRTGVAA